MSLLTYAKENKKPLFVTITRGDEKDYFKLTEKQYKNRIKTYIAYYEATAHEVKNTEYEHNIVLHTKNNGIIELNAILL